MRPARRPRARSARGRASTTRSRCPSGGRSRSSPGRRRARRRRRASGRRLRLAPEPRAHPQHLPDAGRVDRLERRAVEDLRVDVAREDPRLDVVAREARAPSASGRWCRTRRSRPARRSSRPGSTRAAARSSCRPGSRRPSRSPRSSPTRSTSSRMQLELALVVDERDHDLELRRLGSPRVAPRAKIARDLHLVDLRVAGSRAGSRACRASGWPPRSSRTRSSVRSSSARSSDCLDRAPARPRCSRSARCGQELVQRRVEQPDRHRQPGHRREQALEVAPAGAAAARPARARALLGARP